MTFAARPDERLFERPKSPETPARGRFAVILALCFLLHAIPIWLILTFERWRDPAPVEQEIPVEVVVEPPPEQPKEPPPEQKPLDEKIATDAPRPANDEKVEREAQDAVSHSPQATSKTEPGSPPPADAGAAKPDASAARQPIEHDPNGEPVLPPPSVEPQAHPEPSPQKPTQKAAQDPLSAFAALPDYSLAASPKKVPSAMGKAAPTYLSIVYGQVMSRIRYPEGAAGHGRNMGEIVFAVDASGRLAGQRILKSSGSPELDLAAMAAIRAASPFPPPPTGAWINLNLRYRR